MSAAVIELISHSDDPKKTIQDLTRIPVSKIKNLMSGRVLVAIYIAPDRSPGGIIIPQASKKEDVYQGVVGLVLKKGALAFKDDERNQFHGQDVTVGDWVTFRPGDAKRIQIKGVECRIVEDTMIDMVIDDPTIVTHSK
jgi:co-chaperonin GroES (HSP10)